VSETPEKLRVAKRLVENLGAVRTTKADTKNAITSEGLGSILLFSATPNYTYIDRASFSCQASQDAFFKGANLCRN